MEISEIFECSGQNLSNTSCQKKSEKIFSELSNNYDMALEKLALKRSSNNEVFECVKKTFNDVLQNSGFKKQNDRYNFIRTILSNCTRILKLQ